VSETTTIKVPKKLRDRLAHQAKRDHVSLSAVIERALDESEDRSFWAAIVDEHAALTSDERASYVADPTVADDLHDEGDAAVSASYGW
jgi:hypothetical protein